MGYYICPKCSSNDTYSAVEIVSEYIPGKTVGFESEFGAVSRQVGGKNIHKEITVAKCRQCNTLLGEKDYFLTPEEQAEESEKQLVAAQKQKAKETQNRKGCGIQILGFVVLLLGIGLGSLINKGGLWIVFGLLSLPINLLGVFLIFSANTKLGHSLINWFLEKYWYHK